MENTLTIQKIMCDVDECLVNINLDVSFIADTILDLIPTELLNIGLTIQEIISVLIDVILDIDVADGVSNAPSGRVVSDEVFNTIESLMNISINFNMLDNFITELMKESSDEIKKISNDIQKTLLTNGFDVKKLIGIHLERIYTNDRKIKTICITKILLKK